MALSGGFPLSAHIYQVDQVIRSFRPFKAEPHEAANESLAPEGFSPVVDELCVSRSADARPAQPPEPPRVHSVRTFTFKTRAQFAQIEFSH